MSFKNEDDVKEIGNELALRFKRRRLARNLSQEGLANRSGVSWGSLKRFERTGLISLESLLRLAQVLECLGDFRKIAAEDTAGLSLDELLAAPKRRRKGFIK